MHYCLWCRDNAVLPAAVLYLYYLLLLAHPGMYLTDSQTVVIVSNAQGTGLHQPT